MRCVQLLSAASNYLDQRVHAVRMGSAYQWYDFGGVLRQVLRKLVVVDDEVGDVNVAVILLDQYVLADLVSAWPLVLAQCIRIACYARTCR
jgi:hypothetical protein